MMTSWLLAINLEPKKSCKRHTTPSTKVFAETEKYGWDQIQDLLWDLICSQKLFSYYETESKIMKKGKYLESEKSIKRSLLFQVPDPDLTKLQATTAMHISNKCFCIEMFTGIQNADCSGDVQRQSHLNYQPLCGPLNYLWTAIELA